MSNAASPSESERHPAPEKPVAKLAQSVSMRIVFFLRKWIALPLLGALISAVVIGRLVNWVIGPSSYKVYLVGAISEPENAKIVDAFTGSGELPKINGTRVEIETMDDSGDAGTAQRISLGLASQNDTLFVVGHLWSTPTQQALPAYLQIADPPIPVILTTETNPNLLPPRTPDRDYYPVFRLSPTDEKQAEKAADFVAKERGARAIWVVEDASNTVYSRYLAREFVRRVQTKESAKVLLWSTNYSIPPAYAISALKVDWVFFAGEWQNALVLIRQLRTVPETRSVNVLLTDWCVDDRLLKGGGDDVNGVYLTHALPPGIYNDQGFSVYGKDAFLVIRQLLHDADQQFDSLAGRENRIGYWLRKLLGVRRVSDARRALLYLMSDAARDRQRFKLSGGTQTVFSGDGTREDATFQVWQIRDHTFSAPP